MRLMILLALLFVSGCLSAQTQGAIKRVRHVSRFEDALAYNVGCGKVMKSRMYAKMRSGNRNIYRDYVDFKRWNGKIVPSIERRRKMEYLLLFTP